MKSWILTFGLSLCLFGCGGGSSSGNASVAPTQTSKAEIKLRNANFLIKPSASLLRIGVDVSGSGNTNWSIDGIKNTPWIVPTSSTSGNASSFVEFNVLENKGSPRTATLELLSADGTRQSILVEQTAAISSVKKAIWNEVPEGWEFVYEDYLSANRPWSTQIVNTDTEPRRFGNSAQRFETRNGDCGGSDCNRSDGNRERSEFAQSGTQNVPGDEKWYGWSMYVPADFQDHGNVAGTSKTLTIGQFQQSPSYAPAWMFGKEYGGDFILRSFPTLSNIAQQRYTLISNADFAGHWHDFTANIRWATDSTGFFKLWINGKLKVDYKGQTMTPENTTTYFKYGIYRIASTTEKTNTVLYFDELRKNTQREKVDIRSIELN
jgi:hypothetical protein